MNIQPSVSWDDFGNSLLQGVIGGVGSGLLGLGFNALSGLVDTWNYKDQADYAFQLQEKAAKNAYNRQLDFWNLQNQYNDPSNQVKRLKGAGLNPALMNGQAMNNVAGGLSSTPMPGMISPQGRQSSASNFMGTLTSALAQLEQTGFLDAETKLMWQKVLNEKLNEDILKGAKELGLTNLEIRKIDREAYYEALYGEGMDGGAPRIKNNPYLEDINAARSASAYQKALTDSENVLRGLKQEQIQQNVNESKALVAKLDAEEKKILRESESLEQIIERQGILNACSAFYGFPVYDLPSTLTAQLVETYTLVVRGDIYADTAIRSASHLIEEYKKKELHIPRTRSESSSRSESRAILSVKGSKSSQNSWSETY
ncbi:MAG: hypothetical protein J6Q07_01280 [Alistipes sp.]|nr:hypothetical protein [Alistipes sp.]